MKTKSIQLLQFLLDKITWVKTTTLCQQLDCSPRTIRNLVKDLNSTNGYIKSSQHGYMIDAVYREHLRQLIQNSSDMPVSSEDRQQTIIKRLLLSHDEINLYDLTESLFVSESTFAADLMQIRKLIEQYHLRLIKQGNSIALSGLEKNIRKLMSDVLYKEVSGGLLNIGVMENIFSNIDIIQVKEIIVSKMNDFNLFINDFGVYDLILHLCIAIDRIRIDQTIRNTNINLSDLHLSRKHIELTKEIISTLEKIYQISFNDQEIYEFYLMIFVNVKNYKIDEITLQSLHGVVEQSTVDLVHHIINQVKRDYYVDLNDVGFVTRFALHLNQIQMRSNNYFAKNPLLKSIKSSYPLMFEISTFIGNIISKHQNICLNDHDISYIALHIGMTLEKQLDVEYKIKCGIVSPDYYILRNKIVDHIKKSFHQDLEVLEIYSDESQIDCLDSLDVIISTVGLSSNLAVQNLVISPFLNSDDTTKIERMISHMKDKKYSHYFDKIVNLFTPDCFVIRQDSMNSEQSIKQLSSLLMEEGYVNENYTQDVLYRESLSSTSFGNIAIPHSMTMDACHSVLGIMICQKPIAWSDNNVNIVLMIALEETDREFFKNIFQQLLNVFQSETFNQKMSKIISYDDFTQLIREITQDK